MWEALCQRRHITFNSEAGSTMPLLSCDVRQSNGKHYANVVKWSFVPKSSYEVLCQSRHMKFCAKSSYEVLCQSRHMKFCAKVVIWSFVPSRHMKFCAKVVIWRFMPKSSHEVLCQSRHMKFCAKVVIWRFMPKSSYDVLCQTRHMTDGFDAGEGAKRARHEPPIPRSCTYVV